MKRNSLYSLLVSVLILANMGAGAETTESFNSRNNASLFHLKAFLQEHCWIFRDFDINRDGWKPSIEGDGAMVSGIGSGSSLYTGIYSPVLKIDDKLTVSFSYKFNTELIKGSTRSLKIYLTDNNGNIISELDNIEFTSVNKNEVLQYNKTFNDLRKGAFKLFINYQGNGGNTRIAIDDISISAPAFYPGGCNTAPLATDQIINGETDRSASGNVNLNATDADNSEYATYTVTNSPDGTVTMNKNGSFTFTPAAGFKGNSTEFTYKICDLGYSPLCSEDAKVTLKFPTDEYILPQSLVDFNGIYKDGGHVQINFVTNFEQNTDRFEIERSLDGATWTVAGSLKGQGVSSVKQNYSFMDKVGRNTANKKDLYYRLKQVNTDTKAAFSRILVVRVFNTRSTKMISVTPNPVKNDIAVNVQLNENAFIVMKIVDNSGIEMMRKAQRASEGTSNFMMDGSNKLKPGMYFLEVTINSKERMVAKLLKE